MAKQYAGFLLMLGGVFLLAGIANGWSDRHKRRQAAAGGDIAEHVRRRHA